MRCDESNVGAAPPPLLKLALKVVALLPSSSGCAASLSVIQLAIASWVEQWGDVSVNDGRRQSFDSRPRKVAGIHSLESALARGAG